MPIYRFIKERKKDVRVTYAKLFSIPVVFANTDNEQLSKLRAVTKFFEAVLAESFSTWSSDVKLVKPHLDREQHLFWQASIFRYSGSNSRSPFSEGIDQITSDRFRWTPAQVAAKKRESEMLAKEAARCKRKRENWTEAEHEAYKEEQREFHQRRTERRAHEVEFDETFRKKGAEAQARYRDRLQERPEAVQRTKDYKKRKYEELKAEAQAAGMGIRAFERKRVSMPANSRLLLVADYSRQKREGRARARSDVNAWNQWTFFRIGSLC